MTQRFEEAGFLLAQGMVPKINTFPQGFLAANNTNRALRAWSDLAEYLMDSGEWMKVLKLVDCAPAVIVGSERVVSVKQLADAATKHAFDFEKVKELYAPYAEAHGGPCQDQGILELDRYHKVMSMVRDAKTVLGIGCGDGAFDNEVLNSDPKIERYVIADASRASAVVDYLNESYNKVELWEVKQHLFDWPTETFDAVFALEIIEHVPDQAAFLHQAWDRVAPGGSLYISTPNARVWVTPSTAKGDMQQHITASTPETLIEMIRELPNAEGARVAMSEEGHTVARVDRGAQ